jgi:HD-like signal output (HDOD) protein
MKRVLFVDDEQPVLEALRARLHRLHGKWNMDFVHSGALALERMHERPYDVIVTDMRMPGMDGAQLLEAVGQRWPETVRIVLSGCAELEQAVRLVPIAHQYVSKPCEPTQLETVVDRCLLLHDVLNEPRLRALVGRLRRLPMLPRIYSALQAVIKDENATIAQAADVVSADPALAARVLQLVNSAFFRLARRISNIEQAVSYLGFQAIRNLATTAEIFSQWRGGSCAGLDLERLQRHGQAVAAATGALTAGTPIADDALLAGLLHDIGYWVLAQECPQDLSAAVKLAAQEGIALHAAENRVFGASHAEIGAYLLGIWGLPYAVVEAVAHHHQPQRVVHTEFDVLGALVIGHALATGDETTVVPTARTPDPGIDASYLLAVHAPFDWDQAVRRVEAGRASSEVHV